MCSSTNKTGLLLTDLMLLSEVMERSASLPVLTVKAPDVGFQIMQVPG